MTRTELKVAHVEGAVEGAVEKPPRKKHRFHPGTQSLRQIKKLQKSTKACIPKAPFERLVREIAADATLSDTLLRFEPDAIRVLQTAAEAYIVGLCRRTVRVSALSKKVTLTPEVLKLVDQQYKPLLEGEA